MRYKLPLVVLAVAAVALSNIGPVLGQTADPTLAKLPPDDVTDPPPLFMFEQYPPSVNDNVVLQWDEELLQAVRALPPGPTVTARAISVLHTAIFDAWAAYDARAMGTRLGSSLRQPAAERTLANKNKAISFAAYTALVDLFPARQFDFAEQMKALYGEDWAWIPRLRSRLAILPPKRSSTTATPMVPTSSTAMPNASRLQAGQHRRHHRGSLALAAAAGAARHRPRAAGHHPQWSKVKGFALKSPFQFADPGPDRLQSGFDPKHIDNLLALTSNLTDRQKVTAEYWADGPRSEFPPATGR